MDETPVRTTDASRRDFLKKSALAGGLAWSLPAVTSLPAGRAWAQTYPPVCTCHASAYGLRVRVPSVGFDEIFDTGSADPSVVSVDTGSISLGLLGNVQVTAGLVNANDGVPAGGGCHATASLAYLRISGTALPLPVRPIATAAIASEARANCDACNTSGGATVDGLVIGTPPTTILIPPGLCNLGVAGLIVAGEQFCVGEVLHVNALHVTIPGIIEVIAAHTEAGATTCPCTTC